MPKRRLQSSPSSSPLPVDGQPGGKVTLLKPDFWPSSSSTKDLVIHGGKLNRRIDSLEAENCRLQEALEFQAILLADEVTFLEEFLKGPVSITFEALRRRVSRLKGAIQRGK